MNKLLIIGCGHMGSALLRAWSNIKFYKVTVVDPISYKRIKRKYNKNKVNSYKSIKDLKDFSKFDLIILAIKPQSTTSVLKDIKDLKFKNSSVIISIIAGKKISFLGNNLINSQQIIRAMPNMPALVGEGMTCLVGNKNLSKKNKKIVSILFSKVGKILWLTKENQIDIATAVSGSGPGFVFNIIDAMEKAATRLGFSPKESREIVRQVFFGSLVLMQNTGKDPKELVNSIAVKGGTTEAGLSKMNKSNVHKILFNTFRTAYKKAKVIGKKSE